VGSGNCQVFKAATLGSCYCQQALNSLLKQSISATISYIQTLATSNSADSCQAYFADYSTSQGISYGTIVISIITNFILLISMKRLSSFEAHVSVDRENATLMIKVSIIFHRIIYDDDVYLNRIQRGVLQKI
jgi:uncharacterized protein with beta-barrel porin domain